MAALDFRRLQGFFLCAVGWIDEAVDVINGGGRHSKSLGLSRPHVGVSGPRVVQLVTHTNNEHSYYYRPCLHPPPPCPQPINSLEKAIMGVKLHIISRAGYRVSEKGCGYHYIKYIVLEYPPPPAGSVCIHKKVSLLHGVNRKKQRQEKERGAVV